MYVCIYVYGLYVCMQYRIALSRRNIDIVPEGELFGSVCSTLSLAIKKVRPDQSLNDFTQEKWVV